MKKQMVQFGIVIIVLVLFIGGYFVLSKYIADKEEKEKADTIVAFQIEDVNKITAFSYTNSGSTISLKKTGDKWCYVDDTSVHISESEIEAMLKQLGRIEASQKIEKPKDLSDYGLITNEKGKITASTNTIVVTDNEKNTYTMYIGDANPYDSTRYYFMAEGDNNVYVISDELVKGFSKTLDDITEDETTTDAVDTEKK